MEIQLGFYPQIFLLVFFRVLAILTPVMIYSRLGGVSRVMAPMSALIALVLLPVVPPHWIAAAEMIRTIPQLLFALLAELLLGAAVGLVLNLFLSICMIAGLIAGWQSSLSMAQTIDPVMGVNDSVLAQIIVNAFIVIFLICNGHLLILKMVAISFQRIPPNLSWLNNDLLNLLFALGSDMFKWGLKLGVPILSTVLIVDCCLGLISRMAPDFDILFLSFPIRLTVGVFVLAVTLRSSGGFFDQWFDRLTQSCAKILM